MKTLSIVSIAILMIIAVVYGKQEKQPPKTDLHTAAVTGNTEAVKQHIAAGSDLNVKEHTRASTPLITAIVFDKTDIALALIDAGAKLDYQNNDGSTALITAAFLCREKIVKALLDKGADKTLRNKAGRTALGSVSIPFEEIKTHYEGLAKALAPAGLKIDLKRIEMTRPKIAEMLK